MDHLLGCAVKLEGLSAKYTRSRAHVFPLSRENFSCRVRQPDARFPDPSPTTVDAVDKTPVVPSDSSSTLGLLRFLLLLLLVAAIVGTAVELVLLEHTEEWQQLIPFALFGLALGVIGWHVVDRRARSLHALQATMILFIIAGGIGTVLHLKGNMEFAMETYPELSGLTLFREALIGATPSLAPGTMALFGAIGLLYAFRHPALRR